MKRLFVSLAVLPLIAFTAPVCHAELIVKCTTELGVIYQATPCAEDALTAVVVPSAAIVNETSNAIKGASLLYPAAGPMPPMRETTMAANPVVQTPAPKTGTVLLAKRQKLSAGMSDIQVLNNRRWGKPQRIARSREARAWHEQWIYESGENAGTRLLFINGRLTEIADPEPIAPAVNLVSTAMLVGE